MSITFEKVRYAIADELDVNDVTPETHLRDIADSLEIASLVMELEGIFGIEIPDEDLCKLFTVADIVNYAEAH